MNSAWQQANGPKPHLPTPYTLNPALLNPETHRPKRKDARLHSRHL